MYGARLEHKKNNNASMAYCIKIFINSLYGKFGQKHFDINIIAEDKEINDE